MGPGIHALAQAHVPPQAPPSAGALSTFREHVCPTRKPRREPWGALLWEDGLNGFPPLLPEPLDAAQSTCETLTVGGTQTQHPGA